MITQIRRYDYLQDLFRLLRIEDYATFVQLIIGFVLAGGKDMWYLAGALAILAPFVYGGLYALNDVHDAAADRLHPIKCTRPIASGRIDSQTAFRLGVFLISTGIGLAFVFNFKVLVLTLVFIAINLAYTFRFKTVPYLEIFLNTITHPLRFAAGMWLAGNWSHWPSLVAWLLPVFAITVLKRIKEMRESSLIIRPVLRYYNEADLKKLIVICIVLLLMLWPFTHGWDFILIGVWLVFTLVTIVGYFHVPALRRLQEYLWR